MPKNTSRGIDLGQLQLDYELARTDYKVCSRAMERAQDNFDAAGARLADASAALKTAARAVIGGQG